MKIKTRESLMLLQETPEQGSSCSCTGPSFLLTSINFLQNTINTHLMKDLLKPNLTAFIGLIL